MTEDKPIACSLGAGVLEQRLATIAAVGADSLLSHHLEGDRHLLQFHADPDTRQRLEEIVIAESECCPFLALALSEEDGQLTLSIAGPEEAKTVADQLAAAFAAGR
jgi:hypothetical protein